MAPTVLRAALSFHAFFTAEHAMAADSAARTALVNLWSRAEARGMDRKVTDRWPVRPPRTGRPHAERLTVLAAAQRPVPEGYEQALIYQLHETVGMSVLDAPNDDGLAWGELDQSWQDDLGTMPTTGILGSATVLSGLVPAEDWERVHVSPASSAVALGRELHDLVPEAPDSAWSESWIRPAEDLIVWELPRTPAGPLARRLVAIAPETGEETSDDWLVGPRAGDLPPLTRYLLYSGKVRYQHSVLSGSVPRLRRTVAEIDDTCARLAELVDRDEIPVDRLLAVDRELSRIQTDQRGLIATLADIRTMSCSVRSAQQNMATALGTPLGASPTGPVRTDDEAARWTLEQLDIEETYLSSAQAKAAEVARVTSTAVASVLGRRRENLTLVQSTLLGAMVMVLTAMQSLKYEVRPPGPLMTPIVCFLGALALFLPPAVLRWPGSASRTPRWHLLDWLVMGLFGAALGWLGTATVARVAGSATPSSAVSVVTATLTAVVGILIAVLWRRRVARRR